MKDKVKEAGLDRVCFASMMGVTPNTVTKWYRDPPRYAELILDLLIEVKELRSAIKVMK